MPARGFLHGIVETLDNSGRFADARGRFALINDISRRRLIRLMEDGERESEEGRAHLELIVRRCAFRDCLKDLLAVVGDQLSADLIYRLRQLNDEWDGIDQFSDSDWWLIEEILKREPVGNCGELFRAVQLHEPPPAHCGDAWQMFANLAGSSGTDHGVPLFMIFLELAADLLSTESGRRIKQLLRRLASEWGVSGDLERCVYRAAQRVGGRGDRNSALLILIDPHPIRPGTYTVKHWYGWSEQPGVLDKRGEQVVGWAGLESAVRGIVQTAEVDWRADDRPDRIEFILPFDLLNLPVERWRKEADPDIPLFLRYAVVVRSLDRFRDPSWHPEWRARWNALWRSPRQAHYRFSEDHPYRLKESIVFDSQVVALVLSEPPTDQSRNGLHQLKVAIRNGVPIVIWHRDSSPGITFRRVIEEEIRWGDGVSAMPEFARRLRASAVMADDERTEIGKDLVLLWDDPLCLPEEFGDRAS